MPNTRQQRIQQIQPYAVLIIFVLIGLALRLWFVSVNELQPVNSPADDGDYYQRALRLATTGQYIDDFWLIRPPLHVFLFAFMLRVSIILGDVPGLALVRAAQIALSLIAIPIGYDLARRLFGQRSGFIFAGMLAVWYPLVELPTHLFTEPLFIMLLLLHLWLLILWHHKRRWLLLVLAGVVLGLTALARSVAIYGAPFILLWLLTQVWSDQHTDTGDNADPPPLLQRLRNTDYRQVITQAIPLGLLFLIPMIATIAPWTIRNYMVYERFIPVDTIGSVNLWLHMEKYDEKGVEILRQIPQRDRQDFAVQDTRRMFQEDPIHFWNMLWRNAWLHFLHIWKAQFLEDFLLKASFYGRPLRDVWMLGVVGDVLWFVFTLASMAALAVPMREGMFRWVALCWIGYTMLTVMLFHLEPRYLMPLWLMLMLYGAWALGNAGKIIQLLRHHRLHGILALGLMGSFLVLCVTYRDYPDMVSLGMQRETHRAAAIEAYQTGDYTTAVREFEIVYDTQPVFVSSKAELGLALVAQQEYDQAAQLLGDDDAQHILLARGALAWAQGDTGEAAELLTKAEKKSGDNIQRMAREWIIPPPTDMLNLGSGQDFGYIEGFSLAEYTPTDQSYRWLQGTGHMVLPLTEPLQPGSILSLRLTGGRDEPIPLEVVFADATGASTYVASPIAVTSGRWRVYRVLIPEALAGQQRLTITLHAPVVIPAHLHPGSNDIRPVSLMVHALWITHGEH